MSLKVAVIGAGWAGLAAAVRSVERGHAVHVFEASRQWGGRARRVALHPAGNAPLTLDNGQHILIGAYTATLGLMRQVGVSLESVLLPMPLDLRFADGTGLYTPAWARRWPTPLDTLASVIRASGWTWTDRWSFIQAARRWQRQGFQCLPEETVASLCEGVTQRVHEDLIEPLCVAALNTLAHHASGQVFLNVLRDALLGAGTPPWRSSQLLVPNADLGRLFPDAAVHWLLARGAQLHPGQRVSGLSRHGHQWRVITPSLDGTYDHVILATHPTAAAQMVSRLAESSATTWAWVASQLRHEAIATVYLQGDLPQGWPGQYPMLALRSRHAQEPAQFAFLHPGSSGSAARCSRSAQPRVALVASACRLDREALERAVCDQAQEQLGIRSPQVVKTLIEKQATFVCSPGLQRPTLQVAAGLTAAGDYIESPYPATLEAAVRSGLAAADWVEMHGHAAAEPAP